MTHTGSDQMAFSLEGTHYKWQLVTETHTHTHTITQHTHTITQHISFCAIFKHTHTDAGHGLHRRTRNEARRDLAEQHGMYFFFFSSSFFLSIFHFCKAPGGFSRRCRPGRGETGGQFTLGIKVTGVTPFQANNKMTDYDRRITITSICCIYKYKYMVTLCSNDRLSDIYKLLVDIGGWLTNHGQIRYTHMEMVIRYFIRDLLINVS